MSIERIEPGPRMSRAVVFNGTVFTAGHVPDDASADVAGQTRQVLARLEATLAAGRRIDRKTALTELIALDVEFHRAIYQLAGNPVIEETITPQWPHMRRSMATVLSELDYRGSAWAEHADIAKHILAGDANAAERAALSHAQTAGRMTEERLRATDEVAA